MRLSIVIPVYNVEAYLESCLDSVLSQEMADFEVIAVDDCSPDGSPAILDRYAETDGRVRVIHLEANQGLGRARNAGMAEATGDYLMLLDSDDLLTSGALASIAARLEATDDPDVLIIDHARVFWNGREQRNLQTALLSEFADRPFTADEHPEILQFLQVAWNKIYKRSFVTEIGLTFPPGFYEDTAWTHIALLSARTIVTLPVVCVLYRQRRYGSILSTRTRKHFDAFDQWQLLFDHLDSHPELEHWRPLLAQRAVHHYIKVLTIKNRIAPADRREFFALASKKAKENFRGRRPEPRSRGEQVSTELILRGNLRAFDAVWHTNEASKQLRKRTKAQVKKTRGVARKARHGLRMANYHRLLRKPLQPNLAVFASLWDRAVAGNPAAIYRAMQKVAPQMHGVWVIRRDAVADVPDGIDFVVPGTARYYQVLAQATYFVNDVNFPDYVVKRRGQRHLQTQHGTPLKHMGIDLMAHPAASKGMNFPSLLKRVDRWDYNLSSNRFSSLVWQRAFPSDFATLESGYPRNDALVNATAEDIRHARASLGIPAGKKAVLFAPTHRDQDKHFIIRADVRALSEALGPDYLLMVRAHYFYRWMPDLDQLEREGLILNVSRLRQVEPIMIASDALITDYSSIMFDYANLDRPMVAFVPDLETYADVRGVYFDLLSKPPGEIAMDQDALVEAFRSGAYDDESATQVRQRFREEFCTFDDGHAAERVARVLFLGEEPLPVVPLDERVPPPRPRDVPDIPGESRGGAPIPGAGASPGASTDGRLPRDDHDDEELPPDEDIDEDDEDDEEGARR